MADSDDPRVEFGLSCPVHGKFYICEDSPTRFVGCCDIDPCTAAANGECPSSALFPASFSSASGVIFVAQGCAAPFNSSIWYTCNNAIPPFLGCCKNNPCNNGCDAGNLVPATLSDNPKNASQFMLPSTTTTSSSSSIPSSSLSLSPGPTTTSDIHLKGSLRRRRS
ncbi:hypothetical protein GGS24DRAFT_494516 [Hypoxylon argillaceum]|nr:hypothetical protein GGS24DRAFT_494516 [Hypoxylon argillaceum]